MKKRGLQKIMKKSGLSQVIATLLIILLSLAVIAVLWVVISTYLSHQSDVVEAQSKFFSMDLSLVKTQFDPNDGLQVNLSLRTSSGGFKIDTSNLIIVQPVQIDVISVADISGSMRECENVNGSCNSQGECNSVFGGVYSSGPPPYCHSVPLANISKCASRCNGNLEDGLTASQDANKQLIDVIFQRPTDNNRIGLVAYNTTNISSLSSVLTQDNVSLRAKIDLWQAKGNTWICGGINDATNKFSSSPSNVSKTMIVMSDGEANVECPSRSGEHSKEDAITAACNAYSAIPNLTIYSIGLGGGVDPATMQAIANCGNGTYFSASEVGSLVGIYQALAEQIIQQTRPYNKFYYLKILFYDSVGNIVIRNVDVPDPLDTRTYDFNLNGAGLISPIIKIEVYPVIASEKGKETIGPLFSSWEKT